MLNTIKRQERSIAWVLLVSFFLQNCANFGISPIEPVLQQTDVKETKQVPKISRAVVGLEAIKMVPSEKDQEEAPLPKQAPLSQKKQQINTNLKTNILLGESSIAPNFPTTDSSVHLPSIEIKPSIALKETNQDTTLQKKIFLTADNYQVQFLKQPKGWKAQVRGSWSGEMGKWRPVPVYLDSDRLLTDLLAYEPLLQKRRMHLLFDQTIKHHKVPIGVHVGELGLKGGGSFPLHEAIQKGDLAGALNILNQAGSDSIKINQKDENGDPPLHVAVRFNHTQIISLLLKLGADKNGYNQQANTPIHLAIHLGYTKTAQQIIDAGAFLQTKNNQGNTPLHLATLTNNKELVKILLGKTYINPRNNNGDTPLHLALQIEDKELVKMLLDKQDFLHFSNSEGNTPLHLALQTGNRELVQMLLDKQDFLHPRNNQGDTPIDLALRTRNTELVQMFLNKGVSPDHSNREESTLLHLAIQIGDKELTKILLDKGASPNRGNKEGNTPLHLALQIGDKELTKILLDKGADTDIQNHQGMSALHIAVWQQNIELINVLVAAGASRSIEDKAKKTVIEYAFEKLATHQGEEIWKALIIKSGHPILQAKLNTAIINKNLPLIEEIIALMELFASLEIDEDINRKDAQGDAPLHIAIKHELFEEVYLFLVLEADLGLKDGNGNTPLHLAVQTGHKKLVAFILKRGAYTHLQNKEEKTALHLALEQENIKLIKCLVAAGASREIKDKQGKTLIDHALEKLDTPQGIQIWKALEIQDGHPLLQTKLTAAFQANDLPFIKQLVALGANINLTDATKSTFLHLAVKDQQAALVDLLLELAADPNIQNGQGQAPLQLALKIGNPAIVKMLLAKGAVLPSSPDQAGNTPLHLAIQEGNTEILQLLLPNGGFDTPNADGHTPLDLAAMAEDETALDILLAAKLGTCDNTLINKEKATLYHQLLERKITQYFPEQATKLENQIATLSAGYTAAATQALVKLLCAESTPHTSFIAQQLTESFDLLLEYSIHEQDPQLLQEAIATLTPKTTQNKNPAITPTTTELEKEPTTPTSISETPGPQSTQPFFRLAKNITNSIKEAIIQPLSNPLTTSTLERMNTTYYAKRALDARTIHDWIIEKTFPSSYERSVEEIIDYIVSKSAQTPFASNKATLQQAYQRLSDTYKGKSIIDTSNISPIHTWDKAQITHWAKQLKGNKNIDFNQQAIRYELLSVVQQAARLHHGYQPRATQLLTLLILIHPAQLKGRLAQVNTGEGKSLIVAMLAAMHALQGKMVDIVTTSAELAQPEANKQEGFFALLGLSVGENSQAKDRNTAKKKQAYQKDIVYGAVGDFQGDILQTEFSGLDIRREREFDVVIADEVDSMLFDNRAHSIQLTSPAPAMHHLEIVLATIWNQMKSLTSKLVKKAGITYLLHEDFELVEEQIKPLSGRPFEACAQPLEDPDKFIRTTLQNQLQTLLRTLTPQEQGKYDAFKKEEQALDQFALTMAKEQNPTEKEKQTQQFNKRLEAFHHLPWTKRPPILHVPAHLKNYALAQIPHWTKSALMAACVYQRNLHYDIQEGEIVPIDYENTGVLQHNMVWSDGLSQMLEIKEKLLVKPESLTTNYLSIVKFFQRYNHNLYGLTGTLGNQATHDFFKEVYQTDLVTIPPHKQLHVNGNGASTYLCRELPAIISPTPQSWYDQIIQTMISKVQHKRAVLIICKHIDQVNKLAEQLKKVHPASKIFTYTGQTKFTKKDLESGDIIIATNIAGRGTDLITSQEVEQHGGLHVCITFLPTNYRVELQNAGRTARQGNKGTAQLILYTPQPTTIEALRAARDIEEKQAIQQARSQVKHILYKDDFFDQFCALEDRLLPTSTACEKDEQAFKLEQAWKTLEIELLNQATLAQKYQEALEETVSIHVKKCLEDGASLMGKKFSEINPQEVAAAKEVITPTIRERFITSCSLKDFSHSKRDHLIRQLCEMHKGKIDGDVIESFREGKTFSSQPLIDDPNGLEERDGRYERKAMEERFGFFLKHHLENRHLTTQIDQEKATQDFKEFEALLSDDANQGKIIANPYFLVLKGNEYLEREQYWRARRCFEKSIHLDPLHSVNGHYNCALAIILQNGDTSKQRSAINHLQKAKDLIDNHHRQTLAAFNALATIYPGARDQQGADQPLALSEHVKHQIDILSAQESHIIAAIDVIEGAIAKGWDIKISQTKSLKEAFLGAEDAYQMAIEKAQANGLTKLFVVREVKPIPWGDIMGLALMGMAQVALGCALVYFTGGTFGKGLITTGVQDLISALKIISSREFSWESWGAQKVSALVLSIAACGLEMAGKALKVLPNAPTAIISTPTSEALKQTSINLVKEELQGALVKGALNEVCTTVLSYGAQKTFLKSQEEKTTQNIEQQLNTFLANHPLVGKALAIDRENGNNHYFNDFLEQANSLMAQQKGFWEQVGDGLGSGLSQVGINFGGQLASNIPWVQKALGNEAPIILEGVSEVKYLDKMGKEIEGIAGSFLAEFEQQINTKYQQKIEKAYQQMQLQASQIQHAQLQATLQTQKEIATKLQTTLEKEKAAQIQSLATSSEALTNNNLNLPTAGKGTYYNSTSIQKGEDLLSYHGCAPSTHQRLAQQMMKPLINQATSTLHQGVARHLASMASNISLNKLLKESDQTVKNLKKRYQEQLKEQLKKQHIEEKILKDFNLTLTKKDSSNKNKDNKEEEKPKPDPSKDNKQAPKAKPQKATPTSILNDTKENKSTTTTAKTEQQIPLLAKPTIDLDKLPDAKVLQETSKVHFEACRKDVSYNGLKSNFKQAKQALEKDPTNVDLKAAFNRTKAEFSNHPLHQKTIEIGMQGQAISLEKDTQANQNRILLESMEGDFSIKADQLEETFKQMQKDWKDAKEMETIVKMAQKEVDAPPMAAKTQQIAAGFKGAKNSVICTVTGIVHLAKAVMAPKEQLLKLIEKGVELGAGSPDDLLALKQGVEEGTIDTSTLFKQLTSQGKQIWENKQEYKARIDAFKESEKQIELHDSIFAADTYHLSKAEEIGYWGTEALQLMGGGKAITACIGFIGKGAKHLGKVEKVASGVEGVTEAIKVAGNTEKVAHEVSQGVKVTEGVVEGAKVAEKANNFIITKNGLKISNFTKHGIHRAIGSFKREGVTPKGILDALKNPLKIADIKINDQGLRSQRFIGRLGEVVINPDTGMIVSVNPIDSSKLARLLKDI